MQNKKRSSSKNSFFSKNHRGLATVLTTLIIILLVLVAVGILWVVIRNVIITGTEKISLEKIINYQEDLNLKYFGFALIDCGYDDPTDAESKINYIDEVSGFTNIAHLCFSNPSEDLRDRINIMKTYGIKPMIAIEPIFVDYDGMEYSLKEDYKTNWDLFTSINSFKDNEIVFYFPDEPYLNGLSFEEIENISNAIKTSYPLIPILLVEAYTELDRLEVPDSIDWVAFDRYGVLDPNTNEEYLNDFDILKSKSTNQKIILIMDSQWREYYRTDGGIEPENMDQIILNYHKFAKRENVLGIIGYLWPSGFDGPDQIGARHLPDNVINTYKKIGLEILEK